MADLKKGDLVYYWDDDERPEKPYVGYFEEKLPNGAIKIVDGEGNVPLPWKHAEPVLSPEHWADDDGNELKPGDIVEVWDNEFSDRVIAVLFRKDKYGYATKDGDDTVPLYWQHAKKVPPISKGTLVAAWNGDAKPKRPDIGFYERPGNYGECIICRGVVTARQEDTYLFTRDHVRPVTPKDLEKWRNSDG